MRDFQDARFMAKALRRSLAGRGVELSHGEALEIVAAQFGLESWNVLAARIAAQTMQTAGAGQVAGPAPHAVSLQPAIPIFRIFSVEKAMEFYRGFLGFTVDWEHRFGDDFPLYCQVSRGAVILHLSEHSGDASPGARAFVYMTGVAALHAELTAKAYRCQKPGLHDHPWGRELEVTDPFANRLTFCERAPQP